MAITKSLDPNAIASTTSVSIKQKNQQNAAILRPEKIVFIGQAQTGKTVKENKMYLASGNADDIGVVCGFGSPMHRMAKKLFPISGNGSKVDTYYMVVPAISGAKEEVKTLTITAADGIKKTFTGYFVVNDCLFEAAADVAGKVATNAQLNPAKSPRGIDLNSYEKTKIPFTFAKGTTLAEATATLKEILDEYIELPFTIAKSETAGILTLTAKWAGSDSNFEVAITDENGNEIDSNLTGVTFTFERTNEAAGVGTIPTEALEEITEDYGITRVVSQYANETVLDKLQAYFEGLRDGQIAQYIICYSSIEAPESATVKGTWDVETLITAGNKRREDAVNVQLVGDFGKLRKLDYKLRDRLAKAGYSHLMQKSDGSYRIMDLISFYHPTDKTNPLFRFDRAITMTGNICHHFMSVFRDSEEWKSVILVGANDLTTNPAARTLADVKAEVNRGISLLGQAGIIANYAEAQKYTQVEIDKTNPDRVNMNPFMDLTGVGRIFDLTNFLGFNFNGN